MSSLTSTIGDAPGEDCEVVATGALGSNYTPTDNQGNAGIARGFSIGTAGAVQIVTPKGQTVTIPANNLAVGVVHPIRFKQMLSAGTTAQSIVAFG